MAIQASWQDYLNQLCELPELGITLDTSVSGLSEQDFSSLSEKMDLALSEMKKLEAGEIANADEGRQVGHYWLRNPQLAPSEDVQQEIETSLTDIEQFVESVTSGKIKSSTGDTFTHLLLVGIGGSALGPQFIHDALGTAHDTMSVSFCDNTDPDGIRRTLNNLPANGKTTLVVVISKSGGTKETRNGMLEVQAAFSARGLSFSSHAVAVTGKGSKLDTLATEEAWLARFPIWDWVGGRTSLFSPVGLLPAALQGVNIRELLSGAAEMDEKTRIADSSKNPALRLSGGWFLLGNGRGEKDMVILPYRDRLSLFSKYLQQLVMESLGKEKDRDGALVEQGIAVYGNKGSTDQHAYIQQLRDGLHNFFATFLVVLDDHAGSELTHENDPIEVEKHITSGDYLYGFYLGTRAALAENDRASISIIAKKLDARTIGALIALYERAVGFYATFVNVNAYHQPGVEAGKKAASNVIELQQKILEVLTEQAVTASELAETLGVVPDTEIVHHILTRLAENTFSGVTAVQRGEKGNSTFAMRS